MSNPFFYLGGLLLLAAYPLGIEPLRFARATIAPWAALGAVAFYAAVCWSVLRTRPYNAPLLRLILKGLALLLYAELIFIFHFPLWVWELDYRIERDPLASSALSLAPLFALYGVLAVIHSRLEPRSGGLGFGFRSFAGLSLLPLVLMLLLDEAFSRVDALGRLAYVYPAVAWILALGGLCLLMVFLPPLLRFILGARPMDPGPLRTRLERMADAAGYGGATLLVVPTGNSRMANAFVAGLSSVWRYIFFTKSILEGMHPQDLECVLAHEVTHARKRHIVFYLVSALAFSLFSALAHEALDDAGIPAPLPTVLIMAWAALYWGLGFGWVSRRFETEADLVAARLAPAVDGSVPPYVAARSMASALHRVADLNHVPIWAPSWRHFTIQRRIDILLEAEQDASVGKRFERVCDRLRAAAAILVVGALICGGWIFNQQYGRADQNRTLYEAYDLVEKGRVDFHEGRYPKALERIRKGIDAGSINATSWFWRADAERALGRVADATNSETEARKYSYSDPRFRMRQAP